MAWTIGRPATVIWLACAIGPQGRPFASSSVDFVQGFAQVFNSSALVVAIRPPNVQSVWSAAQGSQPLCTVHCRHARLLHGVHSYSRVPMRYSRNSGSSIKTSGCRFYANLAWPRTPGLMQ